jgi:hypothetical protein
MNEQNKISEKDRRLLEEIEQIALHNDVERQQEDSLYGFCAHLASTVPQAGQDYQQSLDIRLAEKWRQVYGTEIEKDAKHRYGHFQAWSRHQLEQRPYYSPVFFARRTSPRRTALTWASFALLVVTLFFLIFVPPVRALASQFIREVILGSYASVKQIEWEPGEEPSVTPENRWMIETILGGSGGELPPGTDPTVRSFANIQEAQENTDLFLREPGYLPDGYALREVRLPPERASEEQAFLFYGNPDRDIVLFMGCIGKQPGGVPGLMTVKVSVIATNGSVEELMVGKHPAAWIDGKVLAWEAGNILYEIGGHDLSLDMAVRIAESIP